MKSPLAKFNLGYSLFLPLSGYATRCHYRRIVIRGRENLPWGERFIIAPTHQNALMDPMVILQLTRRPVVFLARADVFRKPVLRAIFTWLRMMPIYRIRDGRESLSQNDEIFRRSREVLEDGVPLCLMAEGTHNHRHQLLPLVKGMFRIACGTQRELGDKPLYIVPVGLDYDEYEQPYHSVCVDVGKPIDVRQYMEQYECDAPHALNRMRDDLAAVLKAQIHQVGSDEHYDEEYAYCHFRTQAVLKEQGWRNDVWYRYKARQLVSRHLSEADEEQRSRCYAEGAAFAEKCARRSVPLWFASKDWTWGKSVLVFLLWVVVGMIFGLLEGLGVQLPWLDWPLWLAWIVADPIVYLPTHLIAKKKIKDPQFRSSVNYGIRFGATLLWIIGCFIATTVAANVWAGLSMVALGMLSAHATPKMFALLRDACYRVNL